MSFRSLYIKCYITHLPYLIAIFKKFTEPATIFGCLFSRPFRISSCTASCFSTSRYIIQISIPFCFVLGRAFIHFVTTPATTSAAALNIGNDLYQDCFNTCILKHMYYALMSPWKMRRFWKLSKKSDWTDFLKKIRNNRKKVYDVNSTRFEFQMLLFSRIVFAVVHLQMTNFTNIKTAKDFFPIICNSMYYVHFK